MKSQGLYEEDVNGPDIFVGAIGDVADMAAQKLVYNLRNMGISAERDLCNRSVKAQMKYANKLGARFTVVLGDDEITNNSAEIKNMETGETSSVFIDAKTIAEFILK